jgi:hypothetical protein
MESPVKKINKWLIWLIIWGTLLWLTSLQKWERKWIIGRGVVAFVSFWRKLLDKAERRGTALWSVKKTEKTPKEVKHESEVQ